ncbi:hypothetical protein ACFYOD_37865 [Streptomyces sp. NPDC006703]|uniref:hypothetical protein n=1 Tax=Streptomyces sp. NPDC006703 TaxID=3364759 RepID=UPI0036982DF0
MRGEQLCARGEVVEGGGPHGGIGGGHHLHVVDLFQAGQAGAGLRVAFDCRQQRCVLVVFDGHRDDVAGGAAVVEEPADGFGQRQVPLHLIKPVGSGHG